MAEGYRIPDRIPTATDGVAGRLDGSVRTIDLGCCGEEVRHVIDLSNARIEGNWDFSPVTQEEV